MKAEFNVWKYLKTTFKLPVAYQYPRCHCRRKNVKQFFPCHPQHRGQCHPATTYELKRNPNSKCTSYLPKVNREGSVHCLYFLPVSMSLPLAASLSLLTAENRAEVLKGLCAGDTHQWLGNDDLHNQQGFSNITAC